DHIVIPGLAVFESRRKTLILECRCGKITGLVFYQGDRLVNGIRGKHIQSSVLSYGIGESLRFPDTDEVTQVGSNRRIGNRVIPYQAYQVGVTFTQYPAVVF